MVNLPNKITLARILLIPVFIIILYIDIPYRREVAAAVFILLALSDTLDGYIARKTNKKTDLGGFMDPLADKLLISSALIFLIGQGIEAWMAFIIIAREFAVTGLRLLAVGKNIKINASSLGKIKTDAQVIGIIAVLLNFDVVLLGFALSWWLMLIAVIFTIISGLDYFLASKRIFEE